VGLYLNEIVRMRRAVRERLFGGKGKPPSASGKAIKVEQE
jgi:hypothetical protein